MSDSNVFVVFLARYLLALLVPLIPGGTTPKRAAHVIANAVLNEKGSPMHGSDLVRDKTFQNGVVAETRAFHMRET
jgi:hypothetical protein